MSRRPEIGSIQLYPKRALHKSDKNGFVLKFYCPIRRVRIRKNCGTRERREARKVLLECRERLLNGEYLRSGGAITQMQANLLVLIPSKAIQLITQDDKGLTWEECYERYKHHRATRSREKSLEHALSRIAIIERIYRKHANVPDSQPLYVKEVMKLDQLEFIQDQLLAGDECRYDQRSPNTVNSTMAAFMAFVRFCHKHEWIEKVPNLEKLETVDVMKGRPVTGEEFERMLAATTSVVGPENTDLWKFALSILWESGFRISELVDFSWDDEQRIHPVWPNQKEQHPYLVIPPTQKNGRYQEIPMLPGLQELLENVPHVDRKEFVVNLKLQKLKDDRLSLDCVSRTIAEIGKVAGVVVVKENKARGIREKFASAHDLRRGCAYRLINSGVSAETLKVVMRHMDFNTTQKHYGAIRSAQAASKEVREKLNS
jgi:integrase